MVREGSLTGWTWGRAGFGRRENLSLTRVSLRRRLAAALSSRRLSPEGLRERQPQCPAPESNDGIVILPFGRYFAARADMLTRDGIKTTSPIDGVSPFGGVGDLDPDFLHLAHGELVNDRAITEVEKNLGERFARAQADYLVVDNSTALLMHREVSGRFYTVVPNERTTLMDNLWNSCSDEERESAFRISRTGLTDRLMSSYDAFVETCLTHFSPTRIILIRSYLPRLWVDEEGTVAPTNLDRRDARVVAELDDYFIAKTGCVVASTALRHVPALERWQSYDHRLRRAMEEEIVSLCSDSCPPHSPTSMANGTSRPSRAADLVVSAARHNRRVDQRSLRRCFEEGPISYDDLLALVYLQQNDPEPSTLSLVRDCVLLAVRSEATSFPLADTKRRFCASLQALRDWRWLAVGLPEGDPWKPQIAVPCGSVVYRFLDAGVIQQIALDEISVSDAASVVDGSLAVTPANIVSVVSSWPVYIERARRGMRAAPTVAVSDVSELIDTCYWLDWANIFEHERVFIRARNRHTEHRVLPNAKTDLSILFDPTTRVGTVGGGLMDQVTHIALFDQLCQRHGLQLLLDDFRYIWWPSHNGFEASRLAPHLDRKRITRMVSAALIESFREEVMRTRLPWVFNQSRTWFDFGLREAIVVTKDYFNSRRLLEIGPTFPVRVYMEDGELEGLFERPPSRVCFFTTQHRIPVEGASAAAIQRVFSYRHLLDHGLDPEVAETAEFLRRSPHVALHIRRGDYLTPHFDTHGWHARQEHYVEAMRFLIESEFGTDDIDVAVFSDDLQFVEDHIGDYGIDLVKGEVRFVRGNHHFRSIFDSYLMSLCPVVVGSVGSFAATTSLLADPPSVFIRARPGGVRVEWRR